MLKSAETEMRKLKVLVYEDSIDAVLRFLGEVGAAQFIDISGKLGAWGGTLKPYEVPTQFIDKCSNIISRIDRLIKSLGIKPEEIAVKKVPLAKKTSEEMLAEIEGKLSELEKQSEEIAVGLREREILLEQLKTLTGPEESSIKKAVKDLEEKYLARKKEILLIKASAENEKHIAGAKPSIGKVREDLLSGLVTAKAEEEMAEAKAKLVRTAKTVYFEAWVPSARIKEVMDGIKEVTDGNCLLADEPPAPSERAPAITAAVAVKHVPSLFSAYQKIVYSFGYPGAHELDPTSIMAITFPIIFGIMFADIGQGAILVAVGALLTRYKKKVKPGEIFMGEIGRYLCAASELFIMCGVASVAFGFLFGEFFGPSEIFHPILFDPLHSPMVMLRFSVLVGVVHISLSIILRIVAEIRVRHYKIVPASACWLWFILGGTYMWLYWRGISQISKWFAEGSVMMVTLIILPLILMIVVTGIAEGFVTGISHGLEVFSETLSHTMSYCRLMALALCHSAMNWLFLIMAGAEHGHIPLSGIPIIFAGTVLVMIFEGLAVFVHTLRLHWVEWFSAFYKGEGTAPVLFKPFKFTYTY